MAIVFTVSARQFYLLQFSYIVVIGGCLIYVRQVYYFRKATLKTADKRYSSLNNDYEMTFSSETEVSQCDDEDTSIASIPTVTFNFVPINQLENHPPNSTIGACCVRPLTFSALTLVG